MDQGYLLIKLPGYDTAHHNDSKDSSGTTNDDGDPIRNPSAAVPSAFRCSFPLIFLVSSVLTHLLSLLSDVSLSDTLRITYLRNSKESMSHYK